MRRIMQLIRKILEAAESRDNGRFQPPPEWDEYTSEQVHYHVGLCCAAGYLDARPVSGAEEPFVRYEIGNLTWSGHEKLDEL